jgi:hypothetical protein
MKREEFDRLLDDFLDGELSEEGKTLLRSALEEDSGLAEDADGLERLEKTLQSHFTLFREARAPEKDYASRIIRRLRLEKETAGGLLSLPRFRYFAVVGYTFLIALFSVLVTLNVITPGLVEKAAERVRPETDRIVALQDENRTLKAENQNLQEEVREAKEQLNPDVNQPMLRIDPSNLMNVRSDQNTEPLFDSDDEGMEQPYYKADKETIARLWGIDPEEIGADESREEQE